MPTPRPATRSDAEGGAGGSAGEAEPGLVELYNQGERLYRRLPDHIVQAPMVIARAATNAEVEQWRLRVEQSLTARSRELARCWTDGVRSPRNLRGGRKLQLQRQLAQLRRLISEDLRAS